MLSILLYFIFKGLTQHAYIHVEASTQQPAHGLGAGLPAPNPPPLAAAGGTSTPANCTDSAPQACPPDVPLSTSGLAHPAPIKHATLPTKHHDADAHDTSNALDKLDNALDKLDKLDKAPVSTAAKHIAPHVPLPACFVPATAGLHTLAHLACAQQAV